MGASRQKPGKSELALEMSPSAATGRIFWLRNSCGDTDANTGGSQDEGNRETLSNFCHFSVSQKFLSEKPHWKQYLEKSTSFWDVPKHSEKHISDACGF